MTSSGDDETDNGSLGQSKTAVSFGKLDYCRHYLRLLAATGLNQQLRAKLDPSDIVQQTMLQAYKAKNNFRGTTENELMAWVKQILTRNLIKAARDFGRQKRDVAREQSIEATLQRSWLKVDQILAESHSSPLDRMTRQEEQFLLCNAVSELPEFQRRAVELHHFLGMPISQVAKEMEKTPVAVSGLLKRGLRTLRERFKRKLETGE
jgi:RNA polymerase sigma-70 factor (ECF subfamily)